MKETAIKFLVSAGMGAQFARFFIVGGINTALTYGIYLAILWLGATPVYAYSIGYIIGIIVSYVLNLKVTFQRAHSLRKMLFFPLVYVAQYCIGLFALHLFLSWGVVAEIAGLLILPITVPITFLFTRILLK